MTDWFRKRVAVITGAGILIMAAGYLFFRFIVVGNDSPMTRSDAIKQALLQSFPIPIAVIALRCAAPLKPPLRWALVTLCWVLLVWFTVVIGLVRAELS